MLTFNKSKRKKKHRGLFSFFKWSGRWGRPHNLKLGKNYKTDVCAIFAKFGAKNGAAHPKTFHISGHFLPKKAAIEKPPIPKEQS